MAKRNYSNNRRLLLPYNKFLNAQENNSKLTVGDFGFPLSRPMRPHALEVRFAHLNPSGVRFRVYAGNGEEVYQSPALVAGPAPQFFRVTLPANTDFALYNQNTQTVMEFGGAATYAVRLIMAHKENTAQVPNITSLRSWPDNMSEDFNSATAKTSAN